MTEQTETEEVEPYSTIENVIYDDDVPNRADLEPDFSEEEQDEADEEVTTDPEVSV